MTAHEQQGGGDGRPLHERPAETTVIRHEEEANVDTAWRGVGFLRARRSAQLIAVREELPVDYEQLVHERVPVTADDSGEIETLPDGSLSIPLYEEELVVTKRTVLRERVIIRKEIHSRTKRIEAELRREHVEIDADEQVEVIDDSDSHSSAAGDTRTQ